MLTFPMWGLCPVKNDTSCPWPGTLCGPCGPSKALGARGPSGTGVPRARGENKVGTNLGLSHAQRVAAHACLSRVACPPGPGAGHLSRRCAISWPSPRASPSWAPRAPRPLAFEPITLFARTATIFARTRRPVGAGVVLAHLPPPPHRRARVSIILVQTCRRLVTAGTVLPYWGGRGYRVGRRRNPSHVERPLVGAFPGMTKTSPGTLPTHGRR